MNKCVICEMSKILIHEIKEGVGCLLAFLVVFGVPIVAYIIAKSIIVALWGEKVFIKIVFVSLLSLIVICVISAIWGWYVRAKQNC